MQCDICGIKPATAKSIIEGTEMQTCSECGQFGKVVKSLEKPQAKVMKPKIRQQVEEPMQVVVDDFSQTIKKSREKLGLSQEDFAKKINEKVSLVHNLESGRYKPSIELAKKIEHFLKVRLIEDYEEREHAQKGRSEDLTIGDVIEFKKT
ncbi:MAG: multiprotein bridging factor aMBF1 [Candidatus Woesearchaeota archaeon]